MKIKRLDIHGFKSFVDRTSLDFQQNITGVVGPNGCGKSNIVDAIRWVMGEQSPKNLRGKSMEDVIFGGSESRKPLGMAEVSLVFSTEDGRIPAKYLNFSEIQVTRRLYRSGESEYLLNKVPCRLLDITELFMDTGAGARAYSIIEQGKIGMIINSKPEDRRSIIEEAAGVVKYKSRKQVALKKIEITRQNLVRIGDIVAEIRRQLNSLQRQARKAAKFREYREELKEIELLFAARNWLAIEGERKLLEEEISSLHNQLDSVVAELESGELDLEEKKIALLEEEKVLSARQEEIYQIKGDIRGAENRLEFQQKEMQNLERHMARFTEESGNLHQQLLQAEAERKSLKERNENLHSSTEGEERNLLAAEEELAGLVKSERVLSEKLEGMRRDLLTLLAEIAQFNNQHAGAAKRLEMLEESAARNNREVLSLQEKLAEISVRKSELESVKCNLVEQKETISEELSGLKSRENQVKENFAEVSKRLSEKRQVLNKKESRLHSLQELEAHYEGYGQGIRSLFLNDRFKGLFKGILADYLDVEEKYELALEAVLGERLQYVMCPADADALSAIDYLREISGGRCSFISNSGCIPGVRQKPAGLQMLLDKITSGDDCAPLVEAILENVCLVDDLPSALSLAPLHPQLIFVTPGGDMVLPGGIIHGGSTDAAQQGLVHKKREIKVLSQEVQALQEELRKLESLRNQLLGEMESIDERLKDLRQSLHQMEMAFLNNDKDLQRAREECQRIDERIVVKGLEDEQMQEERADLLEELARSDCQRALRESRKSELEKETEELQALVKVKRLEIDASRETVTGLKIQAAALKEQRESTTRALRRIDERAKDLHARIANHGAELEKGKLEKTRLYAAISQSEEDVKKLLAKHAGAESIYNTARDKYESQAGYLQEKDATLKGLRGNAEELRKASSAKSIRFSEIAASLRHMEDSLREKYRVELSSLLADYSAAEYDHDMKEARLEELQKLVDDMGEVNLMAIDEFRELEERFDFLSSQKSDLEESLQGLQQAIQRINRTTRKRFLDTFVKVNERFQEVFPRLFCGGKAELKLTDEEDLLETGIDIIIQPPGKKLQNISLLSGGEKALTAVALMFSIFLIKPTPFCLLDEVDAPLDDANINRFNEMIKEMGVSSQFIMITHNKNTMSCADCLYGVTMEEPGVSKLVSVKLQ